MNTHINTAVKIIRGAANMMLRSANDLSSMQVENKASYNFVLEVKKIAEEILVSGLLEIFPQHKIRTEKSFYHGNIDSEYEWIVNPLDGMINYLHHHPQYAISIGLLHKGSLLDAIIFAPERNDLYIASKGKGAFLNDKRIRVAKRIHMNECLIGMSFSMTNELVAPAYLAILQDILVKTAGIRTDGVISLDLCNVAQGCFDGYFNFNLKPWEVVAGALIIMESGGMVTTIQGKKSWLEDGNIVAANPKILAQLLQIISQHININ